jgi:hypothetical protein
MINTLTFLKRILDESKIEYWLDFGCLLHLYRDNELSKDDVDFGLKLENYNKLKEILEKNKSYFEMIHYRDKEISIRINNIKFDFIFFKQKENDLYFYAYKQNPYCNNKWNWEWRGKFPYSVYFPLKQLTFKHLTFNVPNKIEKKIEMQYGDDWKIPRNVACWTYELNQVKDENYKPIAVLMTTFLRDDIMKSVIPSYLKYPIKLYLLDQGKQTPEKEIFYDTLRKQGHCIEYSSFDIGLSKARNLLLDKIEDEEYVLLTEDDIELTSNPYSLLSNFSNNNLGILGGLLKYPNNNEQHYEYELELKDNKLYYKKSNQIDIVLNFYLAKRKVFNEIRYDDNLKLVEHTDFFLRLKELNKYKVDYNRRLTGIHHKIKTEVYAQYRYRTKEFIEKFKNKWNIADIIKEDKSPNDFSDKLTVFVLSCGNNPNYEKCIDSLNNQTIKFNLDIIKDCHPMGVAFQEMINRCQTDYYIQVDEDMILDNNSIEVLYNSILSSDPKTAMVCYKLKDVHLNRGIDGIKIYKFSIFNLFPYNINVLSCEMEQLDRLKKAGYNYKRCSQIIGLHCPLWTKETIFERYYNYIDKYKKFGSKNYTFLLNNLLKIFLETPNQLNLYAFIGGLASIFNENIRTSEKDFTRPLLKEFKKIDETFNNFKNDKEINIIEFEDKIPVLQISSIPCAGRPYEISTLINKYSKKYSSRYILGSQYSSQNTDIPYRDFPYDLLLSKNYEECIKLIKDTTILHIHHNIDKKLVRLIQPYHKIIWTVSNLNQSYKINETEFNKQYNENIQKWSHIITTTNEPLQQQAFDYLTNYHLPLIKNFFDYENVRNKEIPVLVFAPTNRTREGIASKGYHEILGIIYKLYLEGYQFTFDLIEGIPYLENINRKKMADIIIDDIIHPTFHNSSIEGACFGSVVLTNFSNNEFPFIKTEIHTLETILKNLLNNKNYLKEEQQKMIDWKNKHYQPLNLVKCYDDIYDLVLTKKETILNIDHVTEIITPLIERVYQFLETLNRNKIPYTFLDVTCKEIIIKKTITQEPIYLETSSLENKQIIEGISKDNQLKCEVSIGGKKNKTIKFLNSSINVPFPVIKYLEQTFNKKIEQLQNE